MSKFVTFHDRIHEDLKVIVRVDKIVSALEMQDRYGGCTIYTEDGFEYEIKETPSEFLYITENM